jgi:NADH-quinone oxidoreductase subunit I
MAFGLGLLNGLRYTFTRIAKTYVGDLRHLGRSHDPKEFARRQSVRGDGIFTAQYPEEKVPVPENFRFIPFLVYEPKLDENGKPLIDQKTGAEVVGYERCTACGICAKVCPPQCIWIVRGSTPEGKPKPQAAEFYIDIDICMNCGYCAEYCPFDAIKMDHDYELADYERHTSHIYDLKKLLKSTTYHSKIHPLDWAREETDRKAKEAAKAKKTATPAPATPAAT